nr:hypothetical protein [Tanacetum cinerariifolium]
MAEENLPAPTRSDEQLVPTKARLPYGKSNILLNLHKLQKNPIFCISVDILQNTNFFKAFSASANVPSIYIQQFWNTITHEAKTGVYKFQLDEQWFTFNSDLLCDALEITLVDPTNPFVSPSAGEIFMDFVNELGYPKAIHFVSHMRPEYPRHVAGDDFLLGNLKFILKAARKVQAKEGGRKKTAPKADKLVKPAPAKQSKPVTTKQPKPKHDKEKSAKPTPLQKAGKGEEYDVERAIRISLELFQVQGQAHVGGVAILEPVVEATRPLPVVEGKGKAIATDKQIPVTEETSTRPSEQPDDDSLANIISDTLSLADAETCVDTYKTNSEGDTEILNIGGEQ